MVKNTGHLIRLVAALFALVGCLVCVYLSVLLSDSILMMILKSVFGGIISWLVSVPLMGFGEMVERAERQEVLLREIRDELRENTHLESEKS